MLRYRAKALLPSTWPDILQIMFGSLTCLYALPTNVRRARWLLATSFNGLISVSPVLAFLTSTLRVMPEMANISFIASLYFCDDMKGNKRPFLSAPRYFSTKATAFSCNGTFAVTGVSPSSLVLCGVYSSIPSVMFRSVSFIKSLTLQPTKQ